MRTIHEIPVGDHFEHKKTGTTDDYTCECMPDVDFDEEEFCVVVRHHDMSDIYEM